MPTRRDHVIIAGFGCGGRFIAEYLREQETPFVLVELNADTVRIQCELGIDAVHGSIAEPDVLRQAGIETAAVLALTVPDESASLRAIEAARRINPRVYIMSAARHTSTGMKSRRCGSDDVIIAEQVVGLEFHRRMVEFFTCRDRADSRPRDAGSTRIPSFSPSGRG